MHEMKMNIIMNHQMKIRESNAVDIRLLLKCSNGMSGNTTLKAHAHLGFIVQY